MSDMNRRANGCDDDGEGERGERGPRGHRGHRGHDGHDGPVGPEGPTGPAGSASNTGATGPTGAAGPDRLFAAGSIAGDGTLVSGFGISSVTHVGTGQYSVTLTSPPADADVIPTATINTLLGFIEAGPVVGGVINVAVRSPFDATDPIDAPFFIHVVDGS